MRHISRPRLFIAVNPPDELRNLLQDRQRQLFDLGLNVKWVERQNLHLTLAFLGATDQGLLNDLRQVLADSVESTSGIALRLKDIGAFPGLKQPRVIWMGLEGQIKELSSLQSRIRQGLHSSGIPFDQKPFRPHLTLGRVREVSPVYSSEKLTPSIRSNNAQSSFSWNIARIDLMRSELGNPGPRYTILESFYLRS